MMNLRAATISDLPLLRHWDEQPHVIAFNPDSNWGWEVELKDKLEGREQLIAEIHGRPIGFIEITNPARDDSNY